MDKLTRKPVVVPLPEKPKIEKVEKYLDVYARSICVTAEEFKAVDVWTPKLFAKIERSFALKFGQDSTIIGFQEKPEGDGSWINGGFFVLSPEVIKFISGDECTWENEPLINLAKNGELLAYKHFDFWQPMDTLREKNFLNQLWKSGEAPWKVWN